MKILVFYPFVRAFGGIERLLADLHHEAAQLGIPAELVCFQCDVDFSRYCNPAPVVHILPGIRSYPCELLRLRHFLNRQAEPARLLVMEMYGAMYAAGIPLPYGLHIADTPTLLPRDSTRFSWSAPIPAEWGPRNPAFPTRLTGEIRYQLIRRGIHRADACATMTRLNANVLQSTFARSFAVVPPGVAEWTADVGSSGQDCIFLSVCRLEPSKRVDWIIDAFCQLPQPLLNRSKLWIVGDGSQNAALRSMTEGRPAAGRVQFFGHVSETQLEECYRQSSVFVMPARQGYGLPGLEALARGLRLIVHQESGVSEILQGRPEAAIVTDPASLSHALQACCETHHAWPRLSRNIRPRTAWALELLQLCGWR
ncbi:MAG: glycosyltransferase family 4 protein [Planctomycetaceae bacterium]